MQYLLILSLVSLNFQFSASAARKGVARKKKTPGGGSEGFHDLPCAGPIIRRLYALVRAESTPLASEPMLLPSTL